MKKITFISLLATLVACSPEKVTTAFDCSTSALSLSGITTDANCGSSDGSIELEVSGGEAPYTYSITGTGTNDTGLFNDLTGGSYTATVTDKNSCTASKDFTVQNKDGVNLASVTSQASGCGSSNGSITISGEGGSSPYTYEVSGHGTNSEGLFTGLETGTYAVSVTDDAGCVAESSVTILSGTALSSDIMPIISSNCAISGCHNGSQSPNLSNAANVKSNASRIRAEVNAGTMPPSGKLPANQINLITCWVADGAPNN